VLRFATALALVLPLGASAPPTAAEIGRLLHEGSIDPSECYRVTELQYSKDDLKIYFTDGFLAFAKPVNGVRMAAVFSAEVEAGDAEVLLLPPTRGERLSLANFTQSPNLEEHFKTALLLFTDSTADELLAKIHAQAGKKSPEMGALISEQYSGTLRNVSASFETRLVQDLLSTSRSDGFFFMGISGATLGTFDVSYDPTAESQIVVGRMDDQSGRSYNTWTSFSSRQTRNSGKERERPFLLDNYRIDSTITSDLNVQVITRVTLTPKQPMGRGVSLFISPQMNITSAAIDGRPVEFFAPQSLRSNLLHNSENRAVLLVSAEPLDSRPHEIELHHQGHVISKAGERVFFVNARGTWYPRAGTEFSRYDLTFRYPKSLVLVATGEPVEEHVEGDWRISRRKSSSPIPFAGFNLGDFERTVVTQGPYQIEVCANRSLEAALQKKAPSDQDPTFERRRPLTLPQPLNSTSPTPPTPDPASRMTSVGKHVAAAMEFMTAAFGPPPIQHLTVSPIPGTFGQGFPGLIYLSTLAYLDSADRPASLRADYDNTFFVDLLDAHEVGHQWWGNLVIPASYQDDWLMESLANYSALLLLEKRKGPRALDTVLSDYKKHLVAKNADGKTFESIGPISWGYRLQSGGAMEAWRRITYEKGAWIIHMLRRQMGDVQFAALLREACKRYQFHTLSTEQFQALAEQYAPKKMNLKSFFDTWVYGTGIPAVTLEFAVNGLKVTGTLGETDVAEDFATSVPVEVQTGRQKSVYWLTAGSEPVPFSIALKQPATKVTLLMADCLITHK
jgi:Peptidase family M1 domain